MGESFFTPLAIHTHTHTIVMTLYIHVDSQIVIDLSTAQSVIKAALSFIPRALDY